MALIVGLASSAGRPSPPTLDYGPPSLALLGLVLMGCADASFLPGSVGLLRLPRPPLRAGGPGRRRGLAGCSWPSWSTSRIYSTARESSAARLAVLAMVIFVVGASVSPFLPGVAYCDPGTMLCSCMLDSCNCNPSFLVCNCYIGFGASLIARECWSSGNDALACPKTSTVAPGFKRGGDCPPSYSLRR